MRNIIVLFLLATTLPSNASEIPKGWYMSGSNPGAYTFKHDKNEGSPPPSGHLYASSEVEADGFGTLMQAFFPEEYLGKRVRLTAKVKSKDLTQWAAIWMRADTDTQQGASFDNMADRPITGSTPWTSYSIVLDVPQTAYKLAYGAMMAGQGKIWFDEFKFEIVDRSVATTDNDIANSPINNSF